jgi:hypothetical protein
MFIYMGCLVPLYGFSLFLPTILGGMGYSGTRAQLLSVPPYAVAAVCTISVGFLADRTKWRGYCNMATVTIGIIGFIMLIATENPTVQYAGTFLGAAGIYPTIPNSLSWAANNCEGNLKRGLVIGMVVGWGNLNGVVSSNIYLKGQAPRFWTGHGKSSRTLYYHDVMKSWDKDVADADGCGEQAQCWAIRSFVSSAARSLCISC